MFKKIMQLQIYCKSGRTCFTFSKQGKLAINLHVKIKCCVYKVNITWETVTNDRRICYFVLKVKHRAYYPKTRFKVAF